MRSLQNCASDTNNISFTFHETFPGTITPVSSRPPPPGIRISDSGVDFGFGDFLSYQDLPSSQVRPPSRGSLEDKAEYFEENLSILSKDSVQHSKVHQVQAEQHQPIGSPVSQLPQSLPQVLQTFSHCPQEREHQSHTAEFASDTHLHLSLPESLSEPFQALAGATSHSDIPPGFMGDGSSIGDEKPEIISIDHHSNQIQHAQMSGLNMSHASRAQFGSGRSRISPSQVGLSQSHINQNSYHQHHQGQVQQQLFQIHTGQAHAGQSPGAEQGMPFSYPINHQQVSSHVSGTSAMARGTLTPLSCSRCPNQCFWTDDDLKIHIADEHGGAGASNASFSGPIYVNQSQKHQQVCRICNKLCMSSVDVETALSSTSFTCRECPMHFLGKQAIEQHVRQSHDESRQFAVCDNCVIQHFSTSSGSANAVENPSTVMGAHTVSQPLPPASLISGPTRQDAFNAHANNGSTIYQSSSLPQQQRHYVQQQNHANVSGNLVSGGQISRDSFEDRNQQLSNISSPGAIANLSHPVGNTGSVGPFSKFQSQHNNIAKNQHRTPGNTAFTNPTEFLYDERIAFGSGNMGGTSAATVLPGHANTAQRRVSTAGLANSNVNNNTTGGHALPLFSLESNGMPGSSSTSVIPRGFANPDGNDPLLEIQGPTHIMGSITGSSNCNQRETRNDSSLGVNQPVPDLNRASSLIGNGNFAFQSAEPASSSTSTVPNNQNLSHHLDSISHVQHHPYSDIGLQYQVHPPLRQDFHLQGMGGGAVGGILDVHKALDSRARRYGVAGQIEIGQNEARMGSRVGINAEGLFEARLSDDVRGDMRASVSNLTGQVAKTIVCGQCQQTFGDQGSLQRHSARAHRATGIKGPVVCEQCNAELKNEQNLKRHIAVCHTGQQEHQCLHCNASFSSRGSLRIHQQQVHDIPSKLGRGLSDPGTSDVGAGPSLQTASRNAKARPAKQSKSSDKSWACDMCSDTFKWKGNLKRHRELRHLRLRPFVCHICHASFGTKSNMRVHLITHDKPELY